MTTYRYRHDPGTVALGLGPGQPHCNEDEFAVEQRWAAPALDVCPECGGYVYRVIGRANFQFRHGMKGDMRDYREDLARFPNDPQAYVDGPRAVQKLIDQRQREGWEMGAGWAALADDPNGAVKESDPVESRKLVEECFEEAKASNFAIEDWDVNGDEPEF